jgi:hypothetical protein
MKGLVMPWNVSKTDRCPASKPWGVMGGSTGDRLAGCHPTEDAAKQQQAALYAQESKADTVCYSLPTSLAP